jgi:hypothetical protein
VLGCLAGPRSPGAKGGGCVLTAASTGKRKASSRIAVHPTSKLRGMEYAAWRRPSLLFRHPRGSNLAAGSQTASPPKDEKPPKGDTEKPPKGDKGEKPPKGDPEKPPKGDNAKGNDEAGGQPSEEDPSVGDPGLGGMAPAGSQRLADGPGLAGERGGGSVVAANGCTGECDLPGGLTVGKERNSALAISGSGRSSQDVASGEAGGGTAASFELGVSGGASMAGRLAALVLLTLSALGLLVGLYGGLSAFQGRQRAG